MLIKETAVVLKDDITVRDTRSPWEILEKLTGDLPSCFHFDCCCHLLFILDATNA